MWSHRSFGDQAQEIVERKTATWPARGGAVISNGKERYRRDIGARLIAGDHARVENLVLLDPI
jgi:hypothetical protein